MYVNDPDILKDCKKCPRCGEYMLYDMGRKKWVCRCEPFDGIMRL